MKTINQELEKIAVDTVSEIGDYLELVPQERYYILCQFQKAITQVRDVKSCARNQHTTQYCAEAADFSRKLKIARDGLKRAKQHLNVLETDLAMYEIRDAIEQIGEA